MRTPWRDYRRKFMVRGDVANRAARLMNAPQGMILCDEQTQLAAHNTIDFEALPHHYVQSELKALEQAGFIVAGRDDADGEYQFRHVVTRDVTYSSMAYAQRAHTHAAIAIAISIECKGSPGQSEIPLLAYHCHSAGNNEKSLSLYE